MRSKAPHLAAHCAATSKSQLDIVSMCQSLYIFLSGHIHPRPYGTDCADVCALCCLQVSLKRAGARQYLLKRALNKKK